MLEYMNKNIVLEVASFLDDKKAENVTVIDLRGLTTIADYFIIANAEVQTQIDSLRDNLEAFLRKKGFKKRNSAGEQHTGWVLLDYEDYVVHLFTKDLRGFYNLERIWGEGTLVWPAG